MLPYEDDLSKENFILKDQLSIITNNLFVYDKSSAVVTRFATESNENKDLHTGISYFGKKVSAEDGISLIKPKAKIPFQIKRSVQQNPVISIY